MGKTPTCLTCGEPLETTDENGAETTYTCTNDDCDMVAITSELPRAQLAALVDTATHSD